MIPPARPGLASRRPLLAGPGRGGVHLGARPGSSPPAFIVLLQWGVSLLPLFPLFWTLGSLLLSLCLLGLWFYCVFFFMEGAGWEWGVREELAKAVAEGAGTTLSPPATFLGPHPRFPAAAVVTDVLGTV